jgi:uncharacterized membrane protein
MLTIMQNHFILHPKNRISLIFALIAAGLVLAWISLAPEGFEGKLIALGYAVCHQNPSHTIMIAGRLLPLCARCTGMYLGTLLAMVYLSRQGRGGAFPARGKIIALAVFVFLFALDGLNSLVVSMFGLPGLYGPSNFLRLITGLGMGLVLANVLVPLWHNTFWVVARDEPVLKTWSQMGTLILLEGSVAGLILLSGEWIFYPVAILSTLMIPVLLTLVYTLLWMMVRKKENSFQKWQDGVNYLGAGLITAFVQIGILDLIRLTITGTWSGFRF